MRPGSPDPWDKWFPRFVAIVALGGFVYEIVGVDHDRPYLLGAILVALGIVPVAVALDFLLRKRNGG